MIITLLSIPDQEKERTRTIVIVPKLGLICSEKFFQACKKYNEMVEMSHTTAHFKFYTKLNLADTESLVKQVKQTYCDM